MPRWQSPLIHGAAIALTWLRYGTAAFLFAPPPTLGTLREVFPADYGWDLWVVYAVTALVVIAVTRCACGSRA